MKKVLATALVALMIASTVFAGFSGEFTGSFNADFAGKTYGFGNDSSLKMAFDKTLGGTSNEKEIYAKLGAEFNIGAITNNGNLAGSLKLTEASINGANWKVDLTQQAGLANFAGGFAARSNGSKAAAPQLAAEVKTTNGITATYDGWTLGVGMYFAPAHDEYKLVKAGTPKVDGIADGLLYKKDKGQYVVAVGSSIGAAAATDDLYTKTVVPETKTIGGTFNMKQLAFVEDSLKLDASFSALAKSTKDIDLGFGTKLAYAQDKLSASVGADVIVDLGGEKAKVDADVAVNFGYDFVKAALYYATNANFMAGTTAVAKPVENLLDAQVAFDLKSFEIPLALTVTAKDLINDGRGLDLAVSSNFMEGASVAANFGMTFNTKAWEAGLNGSYDLKDIAKFSAGFGIKGAEKVSEVSLNVAAENTTLIENATLKLGYASANFIDKDKAAGAVTASVGIKF